MRAVLHSFNVLDILDEQSGPVFLIADSRESGILKVKVKRTDGQVKVDFHGH